MYITTFSPIWIGFVGESHHGSALVHSVHGTRTEAIREVGAQSGRSVLEVSFTGGGRRAPRVGESCGLWRDGTTLYAMAIRDTAVRGVSCLEAGAGRVRS